jgi:hypothetical protein
MPKTEPVITQILKYLLKEYNVILDLPADANAFARYFKDKAGGGDKTIRDLLSGRRTHANQATCRRLAEIFGPAIPRIKEAWFRSDSLEEFRKRMQFAGGRVWIELDVPHYGNQLVVDDLANRWSGTYLAYRNSFDGATRDDITCEVLRIWKTPEDPVLRFSMSFLSDPDSKPLYFGGHVLPLGRSLCFVGVNSAVVGDKLADGSGRRLLEEDRGRSMFVADARARAGAGHCNLGILSSTKLDHDGAPCAACTILVKVQWQPPDHEAFVREATRMGTFTAIVQADFGGDKDRDLCLRTFLDNSVNSAETRMLRRTAPSEPVLRVNPGRFYDHMSSILEAVFRDDDVMSPFKPNWAGRHSAAAARRTVRNDRPARSARRKR